MDDTKLISHSGATCCMHWRHTCTGQRAAAPLAGPDNTIPDFWELLYRTTDVNNSARLLTPGGQAHRRSSSCRASSLTSACRALSGRPYSFRHSCALPTSPASTSACSTCTATSASPHLPRHSATPTHICGLLTSKAPVALRPRFQWRTPRQWAAPSRTELTHTHTCASTQVHMYICPSTLESVTCESTCKARLGSDVSNCSLLRLGLA